MLTVFLLSHLWTAICAISSNDFKTGASIEFDGSPWKILGASLDCLCIYILIIYWFLEASIPNYVKVCKCSSSLIAEFLHVKPGKGAAFVRTKLKNYITGNTMEKTFRAGESVSLI